MPLEPGSRLGHYEIVDLLGKGGMGEVYRATDADLDREVAIKVLPEEVAQDTDRRQRFEREAKALAALNHTNVATVHGFASEADLVYLAMELVEGPTLADRIAGNPLSVEEALKVFLQIADGLSAAHDKGVVHRDLKPANIKISPEGTVKVLDFGLAKAIGGEPDAGDPATSHSPTLTLAATMRGEILGTAAYMSPEQARGLPVDRRADIWAFGVCLWEALTGARLFEGEDASVTMARVLDRDPDFDQLPKDLPAALRRLLRRCLEKDPQRRLRDIGDVRLELEEAAATPPEHDSIVKEGARRSWRGGLGTLALGAAVGAVVALVAGFLLVPAPEPQRLERYVLTARPAPPAGRGPLRKLALSHDGTALAYVVGTVPRTELVVRDLEDLEARRIEGTEGASNPFFSTNDEWIVFFAGGWLKKVALTGGSPVTVAETRGFSRGGVWLQDGRIVYATTGDGIRIMSSAGGDPEPLLETRDHHWTVYGELPGSPTAILYGSSSRSSGTITVHVLEVDTGERTNLLEGGDEARFLPSGHIAYGLEGTLYAVPFDPQRRELVGNPVPVLEGVSSDPFGRYQYEVSGNGSLAYVPGTATTAMSRLVWMSRDQAEPVPVGAPDGVWVYARLSPDGTKIALDDRSEDDDIFVWDLERETLTRLTFDSEHDLGPVWSRDGSSLFFASGGLDANVVARRADGTGTQEQITGSELIDFPTAVTPDGKGLLVVRGHPAEGFSELVLVDLVENAEPVVVLSGDELVDNAELSPDGRWLAYESGLTGNTEVFVRPFPDVQSGRWQVSSGGGTRPAWTRDGREILYLDEDGQLIGVRAEASGGGLTLGRAEPIGSGNYMDSRDGRTYDVSLDGQQFLRFVATADESDPLAGEVILVRNWIDEVKRLAPIN